MDMLLLTLPVFAVIALGMLAVRSGMIPAEVVPGLNVFVFNFAMPALIVGALARQDIATVFDPALFVGWLVAGLCVFTAGLVISVLIGERDLSAMAIMGQGASVGNIGFLALPLVFAAFGEMAAGPLAIALIVDLVILIPLSIALLEIGRGSGKTAEILASTLRGVLLNPFILSIAGGVALSASGIGLPAPLARFTDFLGAAAGPTALFALGMTLAGRRVEGGRAAIVTMSALKLVAHPVLLFVLLAFVFAVDPAVTAIAVVIAAMPVAGNVFVIAERYGVLVRRTSAAILVSTAIAVATVSVTLWLMRG